VPSCLIHDEDGVRSAGDVSGYLGQLLFHGMGIAPWHDESCGLAVLGEMAPKIKGVPASRRELLSSRATRMVSPMNDMIGALVEDAAF
jgi:hypothetical protein